MAESADVKGSRDAGRFVHVIISVVGWIVTPPHWIALAVAVALAALALAARLLTPSGRVAAGVAGGIVLGVGVVACAVPAGAPAVPGWFIRLPLWLALAAAVALAALALAARLLTLSGCIAAAIVGAIVLGVGGGCYAVPLLGFFITSSLLSKFGGGLAGGRPGARNAVQVAMNGGLACAIVIAVQWAARHDPYAGRRGLLLYLAAIATVNADTGATEIGKLGLGMPRLISSWKRVPHGASGAISLPGTLAAVAASIFIPLCALRFWELDMVEFIAVAWGSLLGSLVDSLLGASVQAQYRDPETGALSDEPSSSSRTRVRGFALIDNNAVNLLASVSGVLFTYILLRYAGPMR